METAVDPAGLEAQAAAWLVRGEAADYSQEERARLEEWLAADTRHRAAYVRMQAAWGRAGQFRRLRPLDGTVNADLLSETILPSLQGADRAPVSPHSSPDRSRPRLEAAFAAAAVAALAIGLTAWLVTGRVGGERYGTDYGGFERITLRDGSTVNMNTDSRIRVSLTETRREVRLERGEALFVVAPDAARPFEVVAAETRVRALGTAFSVRIRNGERVDVLVTAGVVAVDPPPGQGGSRTVVPAAATTLEAGESASIGVEQMQVHRLTPQTVSRKLGWMEGRVWFDQDTLSTAVAEFNRYNRRKLVIADPTIAGVHIGGGFEATDPDSFVSALERIFGIRGLPSGAGDEQVIQLVGNQTP
jgi:transmembrane sensor